MRNEALKLYVKRKTGQGQSVLWTVRSYLPSLLIVFITAILVFALIFVSSMSDAMEKTLVNLGSGNITVYSDIDRSLLREGEMAFQVETGSAVAASGTASALVQVKGVDDDYFFAGKNEVLNLERCENNTTLEGVILSKTLSDELEVPMGGRISLLIWDEDAGRTRPVFCFVEGLYHSGYGEFDSRLIFSSRRLTSSSADTEIYTPREDELLSLLKEEGYAAKSYKEIYMAIYDNIIRSVTLLDAIVILVALLAGFFSLSISSEYVERDRREIAGILLLGFTKKDIADAYRRITVNVVAIALASGLVIGICLSYAMMPLIASLDSAAYPFLSNYVLSFDVVIPYGALALLSAALLFTSVISLRVSLGKMIFADVRSVL
ncbi:MAG: FtsX-like permease family protein [Bullifex sp.]